MSFIMSVATSCPEFFVSQKDTKNFLTSIWPEKSLLIDEIANNTIVHGRYFTLPLNYYRDLYDIEKKNIIWKAEAIHLQKANFKKILAESKIELADIGLIASVGTTGLAVPSFEVLVMEQFSFSSNIKRLPLLSLGHASGVAGVNRVNDYLFGHPSSAAILMVTELCSLTFQLEDDTISNIIKTSLLGDGSGAVVMVGRNHPMAFTANFEILSTESLFYSRNEHDLSNFLKNEVGKNIDEFLNKNRITRNDINYFIVNPGSAGLLEALSENLNINRDKFTMSWNSLKTRGNTSAASILHVLEQTIDSSDIMSNGLGLIMALGPDFSLELCLIRKV